MAVDSSSIAPRTDLAGLTPVQSQILDSWIADVNDVPAERLAYVALVEVAQGNSGGGRTSRSPLLSGPSSGPRARGVATSVTLCELVMASRLSVLCVRFRSMSAKPYSALSQDDHSGIAARRVWVVVKATGGRRSRSFTQMLCRCYKQARPRC